MSQYNYVAVDVAKNTLQICGPKMNKSIRNNTESLEVFCSNLNDIENPYVVCEASGSYEGPLLRVLHKKGISVALVNPDRVNAFARSKGVKAKTDPIDAKMLREFAQREHPRQTLARPEHLQRMAALLDRRSQRSGDLAREKNRREKAIPEHVESIRESIAFIESQIKRIDAEIESIVADDPILSKQDEVLQEITGVGPITSWTLLAYMSEITELKRNQLVSLAGLAPFNRDSGKTHKKRSIQGGRAKVRRSLYMAARSAATHNKVIREYVTGLTDRGKLYQMAIVAAMRKLLIHAQSCLRKMELCVD